MYLNKYQWNSEITRECFENLYSNKPENLEAVAKFLDAHDLPNQEGINQWSTRSNEIEKVSPNKEKARTRWIHCWNFTRPLKKD
jgi:hypothetical protein